MEREAIQAVFQSLIEKLAAVEHERWSHWQRFMHSKGRRLPDGSIVFSSELIEHWEKQFQTKYEDLTEDEKESDRRQVHRYLPLIEAEFLGAPENRVSSS